MLNARRANLVALVVLTLLALLTYLIGAGTYLQVVVWVFSLGIGMQLLILFLVAIGKMGAQTTTSKSILAAWFAAAQPFIMLSIPELRFPWPLVVLVAPFGYVVAYLGVSIGLWSISRRVSRGAGKTARRDGP